MTEARTTRPDLPMAPSSTPDEPAACIRCGGGNRVITDDGHDVCWVCVVAWGRYASLAAADAVADEESETSTSPDEPPAGGPPRDPTVTALLHWSHRSPASGCPLCVARR